MRGSRLMPTVALLVLVLTRSAAAQQAAPPPDSARAELRSVLRAFYSNYASQNWDAGRLRALAQAARAARCAG